MTVALKVPGTSESLAVSYLPRLPRLLENLNWGSRESLGLRFEERTFWRSPVATGLPSEGCVCLVRGDSTDEFLSNNPCPGHPVAPLKATNGTLGYLLLPP